MIFQSVQKIIEGKIDSVKGRQLDNLTDQFRSGRSAWELLELLNSCEKDYLNIATYILGEIDITDKALLDMIADRLSQLLEYKDSKIRHSIFLLLSQILLERGLGQQKNLYLKMMNDEDQLIREDAKTLMANNGKLY